MLDFRMETFLTVCKYMNFTHAAEALGLTQPAVSQHIQYLEKKYEAPLFIRDKKKLSLTPAGRMLHSALVTMRNDENTLKKRIKESRTQKRILTFGVTMTVGEYAVVPALARFIKKRPDTDFHIRYGNTETLLSYLREGSIDFAVVEGYFDTGSYHTRLFREEEYIAVCASSHTFSKPVLTLKDLTGERILVREPGSGSRAVLEKALALKNMTLSDFPRIIEIENIHTIVSLLCQDCGISFLYKAAAKQELRSGTLRQIPLSDFQVTHDFSFICGKNSIFTEQYEKIFRELKELSEEEEAGL